MSVLANMPASASASRKAPASRWTTISCRDDDIRECGRSSPGIVPQSYPVLKQGGGDPGPKSVIDGERGLLRLPGIQDLDAQAVEVLHVPRDDDKVVFKSRCRNQTVRSVDGLPLQRHCPSSMPHLSAIASLTDKMRASNHAEACCRASAASRLWDRGYGRSSGTGGRCC